MGHLLIIEALYSLWYKINASACAAMGKMFNFGSVIASHRSVVFLELGWGGFFFFSLLHAMPYRGVKGTSQRKIKFAPFQPYSKLTLLGLDKCVIV